MTGIGIIDTLKSNFDIREGDGDPEIIEKVERGLKMVGVDEASTLPYLLELLSVKDSRIDDLSLSTRAKKDRIIEALNRNILKGSEIRPVVMAIEDLHWIDRSSEDRFKSLLDNISGGRVFLVFTYRPEFVHTWGGRSYHSQVNLNRLSNRESLTMLGQILGTEDIDKDLEEFILEKTEGVPFFIEEFVKSLTEQEVVRKRGNRYRLAKEIEDVVVPSTVQDVIMARIDSLAEGAKGVLQTGAVVGREFNQDLIQMVTKLPERELLSHLSVLKDSELLYERGIYPRSSYIFKHALTQEVAYNSLLSKRRKAIHEKIGRATEELHSERLEEFCEVVAYHYSRADNYERAYQYLKASGQKASRKYSHWEALNSYREAMNMLNQFPESEEKRREQIEIRLLMSIPMYPVGYPEDSIRILQQGEKLARDLGDDRSIAKFLSNIGHCYGAKGKPLLAIERHESCLQLAKKIKDFELTIQAAGELCMSYSRAGEFFKITEVAPGVIDQLERKKRESGLRVVESVSYSRLCSFYGLSLGLLGNFEDGRNYCERSILTGIEVGDIQRWAAWEWHYGWFLIAKADWRLAIEHFEKSIKHGEDTKHTMVLGWAWSSLGYVHYFLRDVETARNHAEKGIRIQTDASIALWSEVHYLVLGLIYLDLGELRKAQSYIEEALELSRKAKNGFLEGLSWIALGRMLSKVDPLQSDGAEEAFVKGIKILNELKLRPFQGTGYFFLGELYADTVQKEKALENLKKAESLFQEMGMDYWLARTYAVYAGLYKGKGEQTKAKENIAKAIDILRICGADGWVEKYEKELAAVS